MEANDQSSQTSKKKYHGELNRTSEMKIENEQGYYVHKRSKIARLIDEFTTHGKRKNLIWSFTDVDVTEAKRKISEYKDRTGNS
jgi:hypothetical protein